MKIFKRIISMCLSAVMLIQLVPSSVSNGAPINDGFPETEIDGLTYVYVPDSPKEGECTIRYIYDDPTLKMIHHSELEIPEKIDNYTVTALGSESNLIVNNPIDADVKLTTLKLPHSIRDINTFSCYMMKNLSNVYIDIAPLEKVGNGVFSLDVSEFYIYDATDRTYYPTSGDLEKYRELVSIENLKFQHIPSDAKGTSISNNDCYMIADSEYEKNPNINGKLEFVNATARTRYGYAVGRMYAREVVEKHRFNDPALNIIQKMEKITNFIRANTRYSIITVYDEETGKYRELTDLMNSTVSSIAFHSSVCGGLAYEFDALCRESMGDDIAVKDKDLLCLRIPDHVLNAVRFQHSDDNKGYYVVDNTSTIFMQGEGDALAHYDKIMDGFVNNHQGTKCSESLDVELVTDPKMFLEGISFVFLHDETKGALHIEMCERDSNGANDYIDIMSYEETEPETYLAQIPYTKCPKIGGLNLYIDPFTYYDMKISNSKGEAVFGAAGENIFKLGDTEYSCTVSVIPYNTDTPYGRVTPHTAYDGYFDITIKQLSEDPAPDVYTTTPVTHRTPVTTTTPATTTTAKPAATTTIPTTTKPTTATTKATTAKPATTTIKATTAKPTTTTTKATTAKLTTTTTKATTTKPITTTTIPTTDKPTTAATTATSSASILYGDANLDGRVNVADAVAVLQFIANASKYPLNAEGKRNADCDGNPGITGTDAITIQRIDAGIVRL